MLSLTKVVVGISFKLISRLREIVLKFKMITTNPAPHTLSVPHNKSTTKHYALLFHVKAKSETHRTLSSFDADGGTAAAAAAAECSTIRRRPRPRRRRAGYSGRSWKCTMRFFAA
ncbi:hypothetical protein glysoja_015413 [Glycine soja]|nr:hypothetical protein glysoja_015413 [Glycine soja]